MFSPTIIDGSFWWYFLYFTQILGSCYGSCIIYRSFAVDNNNDPSPRTVSHKGQITPSVVCKLVYLIWCRVNRYDNFVSDTTLEFPPYELPQSRSLRLWVEVLSFSNEVRDGSRKARDFDVFFGYLLSSSETSTRSEKRHPSLTHETFPRDKVPWNGLCTHYTGQGREHVRLFQTRNSTHSRYPGPDGRN